MSTGKHNPLYHMCATARNSPHPGFFHKWTTLFGLRLHFGTVCGPTLQFRQKQSTFGEHQPILIGGSHRHIHVFEDLSRSNATGAIGRLHEIVALLTAMFPSQCILENERFSELFGPDQKARAVDLPITFMFVHLHPPLGEGRFFGDELWSLQAGNVR
jgi:hypothetical protein